MTWLPTPITLEQHAVVCSSNRWRNWLSVVAVAGLPVGLIWDISWHISIGRDTFWTPAHIVIQLGGVIPALLAAWLAMKVTFIEAPGKRAASVRFWGGYAPFGAWVTMWGAVAMVTSAPFDDWWHNTYGLDVKIVSPPHALLGLGMFAVELGVLLSVLSWQNRSAGNEKGKAAWLFTLSCGLMVTMLSVYATEFTWPNFQHSAHYYRVVSEIYPFLLIMTARASGLRWGATIASATYMAIMLLVIWILPLFPAQPKLAPIYNPLDRMAPPPFPMLLILPAVAVDLLASLFKRRPGRADASGASEASANSQRIPRGLWFWLEDWALALAVGVVFLTIALMVQWHFAKFLISPSADNWFFGAGHIWPYYEAPGPFRRQFWELTRDPVTLKSLKYAALAAVISARLGLWCGNWMLQVKR